MPDHKQADIGAAPNGFWKNAGLLFLSLLLASLGCPVYNLVYYPGIDGSLPWVFNYFAEGHFGLGRSIHFPHGPLAFLLYPLPEGNHFFLALIVHLLCGTFFAFSVFRLVALKRSASPAITGLALLLLLAMADIQLILIGLVAVQVMLFRHTGSFRHLAALTAFSVLNLYLKTYGGIICGLIVASETARLLFKARDSGAALRIAAGYLLFFLAVWLCLYQTATGSLDFLRGQLELSSDNSEAVQFLNSNNSYLLCACVLSFLLLPSFLKDPNGRSFFLLMLLPAFAAWKHAMARNEELHMTGLLNFLLLLFTLLWLISNEKKPLAMILLSVTCLSAFMLNLSLASNSFQQDKAVHLFRLNALYRSFANYDTLQATSRAQSRYYTRDQRLPEQIRKLVGGNQVDIYPWNYAIVAASQLNWQPRPVINSYASYTRWLDESNRAHWASPLAPRFVVWELTDPDNRGAELESIDRRYLLNDEPEAMVELFANYGFRLKESRFLLFEKLPKRLDLARAETAPLKEVRYGEWVEVPAGSGTSITRAKLKTGKTLRGKLKSLLYKGEVFYLFYELANGKIYSHRIVPKNAEEGLWLNPFVLHPAYGAEFPVKRIKVLCSDEKMTGPTYAITFETLSLKSGGRPLNVAKHCFGLGSGDPEKKLFLSFDQASTVTDTSTLYQQPLLKRSKDCISAPTSYVLAPGQTSNFIRIHLDTALLPAHARHLKFCLEAYVKTRRGSSATLLLARDTVLKSDNVQWKHVVNDQLLGDGIWSPIYFVEDVPADHARLYRNYFLYLSNAHSSDTLYLDDLSVSVRVVFE